MRIALLAREAAPPEPSGAAGAAPDARALAEGLAAAGHDAVVVEARGLAPLDALLAKRGFTGPLTPVAVALPALLRGRFDVVHAFTPTAAAAALLWRRRTGGRVVFTCVEVLDRPVLADRRLRLRLLTDALERSDAVVAASEPARAALERWMAVDAPVLDPADAEGHARLYAGST